MNIYVVPSTYPWQKNPNAGIFTYEQCRALFNNGMNITVLDSSGVGLSDWFDKSCFRVHKSTEDGIDRYSLHTRNVMTTKIPLLSTLLCTINTNKLYKTAIQNGKKPDLLIAHFSLSAGFACDYLSRKYKIPFIVVEHYSYYYKTTISKRIRMLLKHEIKVCNSFICVSDHLKNSIEKHVGKSGNICVIPNMINELFTYHDIIQSDNTDFCFFSAGNLNANKRFDLLIESFCKAFSEDEKVELRIAGSGSIMNELLHLIRKNNREHQITLLGTITRETMLDEYKRCNCFILLSKKETFGIVYREAMAVGRPIIATRNGGIEEGWENEDGILLENDSIDAVADGMLKMRSEFYHFDLKKISERCLNNYSEKNVIDKYFEIFSSINEVR